MLLYLASANSHKAAEIEAIAGSQISIISMSMLGDFDDLPETQLSIAGNAIQKAQTLHSLTKVNCFADDTGLMIKALNGRPGVHSARYAGPNRDSQANIELVLRQLEHEGNRAAYFETVIALVLEGNLSTFRGRIDGTIAKSPVGDGGFGYDSIFIPNGYDQSFAQMNAELKNRISHRALALASFMEYLRTSLSS
ncbi:MAG: RdgB/HAM1 family non-canonical purine NTP pyrophosphatase [Saprospiraceae bacterium]